MRKEKKKLKKEKMKLKKHRDYLLPRLLPLIKDPKFFDPEKKDHVFHYKLENGQNLCLSLTEIDDGEMLILTVKNPDGKVCAEFADATSFADPTSDESPYPVSCSERLFLSDFSEEGKQKVTKRYLLLLEHALVGLMKES